MTARWDRLPEPAKLPESRGARNHGTWRCGGMRGCGEVLTGTWQAAERHVHTHGGGRLEAIDAGIVPIAR